MTLIYNAVAHLTVGFVWLLDRGAGILIDALDRGGHWARVTDDGDDQ